MDHHRAAPYAVLWSNINTGFGSRTFESSGDGGGNGNHSASFSTFWNVKYVCRTISGQRVAKSLLRALEQCAAF